MSMMRCSYCDDFDDTDNCDGEWDVPRINSTVKLEYLCGTCTERYVTEDGKFDPDLPEKEAYFDAGERMAAIAEDQSNT